MGKLINVSLGGKTDWSKGIVKLCETVEYVVGPVIDPLHKLLMAKAEKIAAIEEAKGKAEVARVKAESKIEIDQIKARSRAQFEITTIQPAGSAVIDPVIQAEVEALVQRTQSRLAMDEIRRQSNMESIVEKAADEMPDNVSETPVDKDWTANFFDEVKNISDDEMQALWARILAGEVARPGSYSKRTLSIFKMLTKQEAALFAKLCVFNWNDGDIVYIWDTQDKFFTARGLNDERFMDLEYAGLIYFQKFTGIDRAFPGHWILNYFDRVFQLLSKDNKGTFTLHVGPVMLSQAGKQLLRIVKAKPDRTYADLAIQHFTKNGSADMIFREFKPQVPK